MTRTPVPTRKDVARLDRYRWQAHCRGLYQTPIAARHLKSEDAGWRVDSPVFEVHRVIAIAKRKCTASAAHRTQAILTVADDSGSRDMNIERFLEFLRIRQPQAGVTGDGVAGA